ncbi:YlcI/YnfO family protein [Thermoanaerobacterium sp. DL9XJH110]|uniref:YlcI/YnfO family protein n=1 Tax=Thermoanaerobacterium sp. DL9XJH110 TaxID=3386643 RepID=UPI003BB7B16B
MSKLHNSRVTKMTAVRLPVSVIEKIDSLYGKGNRSKFIYEAIEKELKRRKRLEFLEKDISLISDDIKDSVEYVDEMRKIDIDRWEQIFKGNDKVPGQGDIHE